MLNAATHAKSSKTVAKISNAYPKEKIIKRS